MPTPEEIRDLLLARFPGAEAAVVPNPGPSGQHSILLGAARARELAFALRDEPSLRLDYCSNATGVDWPAHLEVVYHLYSIERKEGPVVIRLRTAGREAGASLPSLTPVWRSCELQEREIFDLFGIVFEGHPDLRRLLMWDEFKGHPMRKDYAEPDDYEWEPTPHDKVMAKARAHYPQAPAAPPPQGGAA